MDEFWACNLLEMKKYKNITDNDELFEASRSFINYVKELFPVNGVPENIANSLRLLEERIAIVREQYEIAVERVCLEIQTMSDRAVK